MSLFMQHTGFRLFNTVVYSSACETMCGFMRDFRVTYPKNVQSTHRSKLQGEETYTGHYFLEENKI